MSIRKIAAYTVVLTAIGEVVSSLLRSRRGRRTERRTTDLESRVHLIERDVGAIVAVEESRTVLPFPDGRQAVGRRSS